MHRPAGEPFRATVSRCVQTRCMSATLVRPKRGTVIAGVCAAIADRFRWSRFLVRLLFVVSIILPGPQFLLYVVLWILIPKAK